MSNTKTAHYIIQKGERQEEGEGKKGGREGQREGTEASKQSPKGFGEIIHKQTAYVHEGEIKGAWLWSQVDLVSFPALTLLAVCLLSKSPNLDVYFFICKMQEFIPIQRLQKKK